MNPQLKIYCLRDRLIDYWMRPFAAPSDKEVLQSVAATVNNPESLDAISQVPQHFEIHQLGYVTEDGHLVPERAFIADCASLVRPSLRANRGPHEGTAAPTPAPLARERPGTPDGLGRTTGADARIPPEGAPTAPVESQE